MGGHYILLNQKLLADYYGMPLRMRRLLHRSPDSYTDSWYARW